MKHKNREKIAIEVYSLLQNGRITIRHLAKQFKMASNTMATILKDLREMGCITVKNGNHTNNGVFKIKEVTIREISDYYANISLNKKKKRIEQRLKCIVPARSNLRTAKCGHESVNYYRCSRCMVIIPELDETYIYNS